MEIVTGLSKLKQQLVELFDPYGFKMVFDTGSHQMKAMKEMGTKGTDIFTVPFNSLSESMRRLIFYKCAIESNHNKVLCFDNPEAYVYPSYLFLITDSIINSTDNQFFITTNSPHIMTSLLERPDLDLAVFVVELHKGETFIHRLSDHQLQEAYDNGMDMFFNLEAFQKD